MDKNLPSKWIRKAIYNAVNNVTINNENIKCYDSRIPGKSIPKNYILMSSQSSDVDKANKCESRWESSILLDIVTTYKSSGNTGSRLLADEITDAVRNLTKALVLDPASGLVIRNQTQSFPNDIVTITDNENIFRKFIRIEFTIN